jgi:hypothetical protein
MNVIDRIKSHYPLPIAKMYEDMRLENESRLRTHKLMNLFEGTSQYLALVGLSIYLHQNLSDPEVEKARSYLIRPGLGHWIGLLRSISKCLHPSEPNFLTADSSHDYKDEPIGFAVKVIRDMVGLEKIKYIRLNNFMDTMVEFRNKKFGHGELASIEADKIKEHLEAAINQWLGDLIILYERNLLYISEVKLQKKRRVYFGTQLNTGAYLESFQSEGETDLDDDAVYLYLPSSNTYLPLSPFLVYKRDVQVLYMYSDLSGQGEARLRRVYVHGAADEWLKILVDKMLIIGNTPATNHANANSPDANPTPRSTFAKMPNVDVKSPSPQKIPNKENALSDHTNVARNDLVGAISLANINDVDRTQSTNDREIIQRKKDNIQKAWDSLQNRIEELREEWIHSTTIDKDRINGEIKKAENQQAQIEPQLKELSVKLETINESQSQRVAQRIKSRTDVEQVSQTFSSLIEWMMQDPKVHAVMVRSRDNFSRTRKQIDIMRSYKNIHDALHKLESECFNVMSPEVSRFPNKSDLDVLNFHSLALLDVKKRIQGYAKRSPLTQSEDSLLADLEEAERTLTNALTTRDRTLFNTAVRRIEHILHYNLPRINRLLVQSAKSLSLPDMIDSMVQVRGHLIGHGISVVDIHAIDKGIQSLRDLSDNLITGTEEHSHWQRINDELFIAESDLQSAIDRWPRNKKLLDSLCGDGTQDFEKHIKSLCEDLDKAIENTESTKKLQELFKTCNKRVGRCFEQIDGYLKDLCDEIKELDEPITSILNQMI